MSPPAKASTRRVTDQAPPVEAKSLRVNLDGYWVGSAQDLGDLLGLSRQAIQESLRSGKVRARSDGPRAGVFVGEYLRGYVAWRRDEVGPSMDTETPRLDAERARKARAEADLAEMKAAQMRRSLVKLEDVQRDADRAMMTLRSRIMSLTGRITPRVLGVTDERQVRQVIEDEVIQALTLLADEAPEDEDGDWEFSEDDEGHEGDDE